MNISIVAIILILVFSTSTVEVLAQQSTSDVLNNYCKYKKSLDPNYVCPTVPQQPSSTEAKTILKNDAGNNQIDQAKTEELRSQFLAEQQHNAQTTGNFSYPNVNGSQLWTIGIVFIIVVIVIVIISKSRGHRKLSPEIERGLQTNFKNWNPRKFEELIADLYQRKGYETMLTSKGPDQGIDIIAQNSREKIVIQTKCWQNKVSNTDVLKTVGAREMVKATKAIIITNSDFTRNALEVQQNTPNLELMNMEKLRDEIKKAYKKSS